jgi:hypothetical protein
VSENKAITAEDIQRAGIRGPIMYGDGHRGEAWQYFEVVGIPRLRYVWHRKNRADRGTYWWQVDGDWKGRVLTSEAAALLLAVPPPLSLEEVAALRMLPAEWTLDREVEIAMGGDAANDEPPSEDYPDRPNFIRPGTARSRGSDLLSRLKDKGMVEGRDAADADGNRVWQVRKRLGTGGLS